MSDDIRRELSRLDAASVRVASDSQFEPKAGELVKVQTDDAYWHLLPEHFLELLRELPDGAGATAVHRAIEKRGAAVWHGPAPKSSRDTSP